jgi:small subunit ribosomal protein S21
MAPHEVFGKCLTGFEPGGGARGAEQWATAVRKVVSNSGRQGRLGADDGQVRADGLGKTEGLRWVADIDRDDLDGSGDARISRRANDVPDTGVESETPTERVFTRAGAKNKDAHGVAARSGKFGETICKRLDGLYLPSSRGRFRPGSPSSGRPVGAPSDCGSLACLPSALESGRRTCDFHAGRTGSAIPGREGVFAMAEVKIQEGESIESALRRFKRKVQQEDIIKDIKKHSFYLKPGDKRRAKQALARKRNRKKMRRETD